MRNHAAPTSRSLASLVAGLLLTTSQPTHAQTVDAFDPGPTGSDYPQVQALALQPDGKILVGGNFDTLAAVPRRQIGRVHHDGSLDLSFQPPAELYSSLTMLGLMPDGSIITDYEGISQFLSDGNRGFQLSMYMIGRASLPDGRSVFTDSVAPPQALLRRLNVDGTLDSGFEITLAEGNGFVPALLALPDGAVLVGASADLTGTQNLNSITRVRPDGTVDNGFHAETDDLVATMILQADGKIVIGGWFTVVNGVPRQHLARLNPDGTLDGVFNPGVDPAGPGNPVVSLALQSDGRILVGGNFFALAGGPCSNIGRLNPDGSFDASFNPGADGWVQALAIEPDGSVLVGGQFGNLGGQPRTNLGRILNTEPATQSLAFEGSVITWLRGGSGPEVWITTFETSTNGNLWTPLGVGTRVAGGWELTGVSVPEGSNLRARGFVTGGSFNASSWFLESYLGPPLIVSQPTDQTVNAGSQVRLEVQVKGTAPFTYQWRKNGIDLVDGDRISGAQTARLTLSEVLNGDGGPYTVVVSNNSGNATNASANLTVVEPIILNRSIPSTVAVGETLVMSVDARGTPPLSYQWTRNGEVVPDATEATLTIESAQPLDSGYYEVTVSSAFGITNSGQVLVVVTAVLPDGFNPQPALTGPPPGWFPGEVMSLAVQQDGQLLVGGLFDEIAGQTRIRVARLNADGTADPATFLGPGDGVPVDAIGILADGRVTVGSDLPSPHLFRYLPDGSPDPAFVIPPESADQFRPLTWIQQPDGGLIFTYTDGPAPWSRVGRRLPDGGIDESFPVAEVEGYVATLAQEADGGILLGGGFRSINGVSRIGLARLNAEGTLDSDFNPLVATEEGFEGWVDRLAVQADGKILVIGVFLELGGQPHDGIARLNRDGTADPDFAAVLDFNPPNFVNTIALQDDGKIILGGSFEWFEASSGVPFARLARLQPDGTFDPEFNPGADGTINVATLRPDGKVLVGGGFTTLGGQPRWGLGRLDNNGPAIQSLQIEDSTLTWLRSGTGPQFWTTQFESTTDGINWFDLGRGSPRDGGWELTGVSIPASSVIRARGYVAVTSNYKPSSWVVETLVGSPLIVSQPVSRTNNAAASATLTVAAVGAGPIQYQWRRDGVALIDGANVSGAQTAALTLNSLSGADRGEYTVAISSPDGDLISAAATVWVVDPYISTVASSPWPLPGGNIYIRPFAYGTAPFTYEWYRNGILMPEVTGAEFAKVAEVADSGDYQVKVSNAFGSVDSFLVRMIVTSAATERSLNGAAAEFGQLAEVRALATQPDGGFLVGGSFARLAGALRGNLGRYLADGTLDFGFNPGCDGAVTAFAVLPEGDILVGGIFENLGGSPRVNLGRLKPDGTMDPVFDAGLGPNQLDPSDYRTTVIASQPDGRILVGGNFDTVGGVACSNLARLNPDGSRDDSFDPGVQARGLFAPQVQALALQPDGKILVGGSFDLVAGHNATNLVRLNPDGTVDESFHAAASGLDDTVGWNVRRLVVQPDGRILVAGRFETLSGEPRLDVGRLNEDGSVDLAFLPISKLPDTPINSIQLQADGRILLGGVGIELWSGGYFQAARFHPDGAIDRTFIAQAAAVGGGFVNVLSNQRDGRMLVGGKFIQLNRVPAGSLGRLQATDPASDQLLLSPTGILWQRDVTSPEVWHTTFEASDDGVDWTFLGTGTRTPGGWELGGVSIPPATTVRARGWVLSGGASSWFVESTQLLSSAEPQLTVTPADGTTLVIAWPASAIGWNLEQNTTLDGGAWDTPLEPVQDDGTTKSIAVDTTAGSRYFRLAR